MKSTGAILICGSITLVALGCGSGGTTDGDGKGTASFSTWGEAYIEEGIPTAAFEDGWSVTYSKFLVVIRDVKVAETASGKVTIGAAMAKPKVFDMVHKGVKPVVAFPDLAGKLWNHVSYQLGPMTADAELGEGATEADKALLLADGAHVHVEGTGTNGTMTKSFSWSFQAPTLFDACKGEKDGKEVEGVVVTNGGNDEVQLTIHGDHLFYDDLQAANAVVRFQAIADADEKGDKDGEVTLAELDAVRLTTIPKAQGGYGTGAAGNVNTLKDFVSDLSRTVGHYRGEGECFAKDPPK